MSSSWNLPLESGDPVEIDGVDYYFERVDPDGAVTFRPPVGSGKTDYMVVDEDGFPRKPTCDEVAVLMRENRLIIRAKPLGTEARRFARRQEWDAKQARTLDPSCQFRTAMERRFDENPWSKSDASLREFVKEALADPAIKSLPGAKAVCPATLRSWLRERGEEGRRQERDGVSMRGRMPKVRKLLHPLEILAYWAVRATTVRGDVQKNHDRYFDELTRINAGKPLNRFLLVDPQSVDGEVGKIPAEYPVPVTPYEPISYISFWRLCRDLRNEKSYGLQTTKRGAYQRYGGGGFSDLPTHLGALCWNDDTPMPKAFFVDGVTGIPFGDAVMTLMQEDKTRVVVGWDLSPGAGSTATLLRTVLCANSPKDVPEDLLAIDDNLTWLRLRPDRIGFDNSTAQHGRSAEDVLGDAYIGTHFVGKEMPRDKSHIEGVIGIFLDLLFKHQEDANYDIARMRLYGYDPAKHKVISSIQTARRLLARAVMTYNLTRSDAHDGRSPALMWKKELGHRRLSVIEDVDRFAREIGRVYFDMEMTPAGIEKFNRRYTAGAERMKQVIQDFESGRRIPKNDVTPKQRRRTNDDRKKLTFKVKIRVDDEDIGRMQVWNPFALRNGQRAGEWVTFECTDPNTHGMPLWLHEECLKLAQREGLEYITAEQQATIRARLFEEIANVDAAAAERERAKLAKAIDNPRVRAVFAQYVEVADEPAEPSAQRPPERFAPAPNESAAPIRKDAEVRTPRVKQKEPSEPERMRRRAPVVPAPPRRGPRNEKSRDVDPRDAGSRRQSADPADQRAPRRARSTTLKWGDVL